MIATLQGTIAEKLADVMVVETHGVGYGVLLTNADSSALKTGEKIKLYIYEYIREQAHELYGFIKQADKLLFVQLLEVNGVGPRVALSILNIGSGEEVRAAIAAGDTKKIQTASGVGKRVAERIVVELKDKVGLKSVDLSEAGLLQSESNIQSDEAAAALISLGFTPADAVQALRTIDTDLPAEDRVRLALKGNAAI